MCGVGGSGVGGGGWWWRRVVVVMMRMQPQARGQQWVTGEGGRREHGNRAGRMM